MEVSIVFCFDNNFTNPAYVAIASLKHHVRQPATYRIFCIIAANVTAESKALINKLDSEIFQIIFIAAGSDFDKAHSNKEITVASYYRLMLSNLLPETVEKVLYLDVDTLINGDVSELFSTELQDNILGAVKNLYVFQVHERLLSQLSYWEKRFGDSKSLYINAGILLINLKEVRRSEIWKDWLALGNEKKWRFLDQDILNYTCKGKIVYLAPKYNATYAIRAKGANEYGLFTEDELAETPVIFHFTAAKPWNAKYMNQAIVWWDFVREHTDLYDYFLGEYNETETAKKTINRFLRRIISGVRNRLHFRL